MSPEANTKIVQQAYNNFKQGKILAILEVLSEDVHWQLPEIAGVPTAGKRTGKMQVSEFFSTLALVQEPIQFEPREFVAQDDKVVALGHYHWKIKSTGKKFESDFAHVFTIRDGKVVAFLEFLDTAVASNAYQK